MKENYQRELDELIAGFGGRKPGLLLHSCCGPCSSSVLEYLTEYFNVGLLWYNPNIYPEAEFDLRLETQLRFLREAGLEDRVRTVVLPWRREDYYSRVAGLENEPEHGSRCAVCFRVRLEETAQQARLLGYEFFCSTLTLSRHKNAELINALGRRIGEREGVAWLPSDFKKRGRELRSAELCREYGLYRQDYCGCEFSLAARQRQKDALT